VTQSSGDRRRRDLLLGEWACLGVLYERPTHGFAIASMLRPGGELGRVWSLSRALTYRSLDQLVERGLVRSVGEEPGIAGGNRTVLAATRAGRAELRRWLATPVPHLRDLRSELLLKLVVAERCGVDVGGMLERQRAIVADLAVAVATDDTIPDDTIPDDTIPDDTIPDDTTDVTIPDDTTPDDTTDVVVLWRRETASAALRFLDQLVARHL
jgi:DNA-binding PadR family transcriptional regulator